MNNFQLSPLKKLEIILEGEHLAFATDLLGRTNSSGTAVISITSTESSLNITWPS